MAIINSVEYGMTVSTSPPQPKVPSFCKHGRVRLATAKLVSDGTLINGVASSAGVDTFNLFSIPAGAHILGFLIGFSGTPGATHTLAIGVAGTTGLYRTAAFQPTAGPQVVTIPAAAWTGTAATGVLDFPLAVETIIIGTSAAAVMPAGTCFITCLYATD